MLMIGVGLGGLVKVVGGDERAVMSEWVDDSRSSGNRLRRRKPLARRCRCRDGGDPRRSRERRGDYRAAERAAGQGRIAGRSGGLRDGDAAARDADIPAGHSLADEALVDTCGTGGDASGTFNISTVAAFVVAGAGVRVAKHGNRSISSRCGSADVLEQLGARIDLPPERVARSITEIGVGFLFAPAVHAATRHAMAARRELKTRTIFNLLGPLTNPASASAQVVGVYDAGVTELMALALGELGVRRAFVVHGAGGLDEVSVSGETRVSELRNGLVKNYRVTPEDFGLNRAPFDSSRGGDEKQNAEIIHRILGRSLLYREHTPHRDIVLANASAALVAAGRAADFRDGVDLAARSIDSGRGAGKARRVCGVHSARISFLRPANSMNRSPRATHRCRASAAAAASRKQPRGQTPRKFSRSWKPGPVRTDSGWNCTPSTFILRWRRPMIVPSAVSAEISSVRGSVLRSTIRE